MLIVPIVSLGVFMVIWLSVGSLLSILSGWSRLANRFPAEGEPPGDRLRGQVVGLGSINERNVTSLTPTAQGLYMKTMFLFRFMRRPVLVPWREIKYVRERKILWMRSHIFDLAGLTTIEVKARAFEMLQARLATPDPTRRNR
ncbi:MAG: hypothetical protein ABI672_20835 [Vicinamibacteria bacterium]